MKGYLSLAVAIMTISALILSFCLKEESTASLGDPVAFEGEAKVGRTVTACKHPSGFPCYQGVANKFNWYKIRIPTWDIGFYTVTDNCQWGSGFWDGQNKQRVDFCIPNPPLEECPCW